MLYGLLTPLQLIASGTLINNQGINALPHELTTAISNFTNTTVVSKFLDALSYYQGQEWATAETLLSLQSIGNTVCPALGDSIPAAYTNLAPVLNPGGFSGLVTQTGNSYLGNGSVNSFAQGFAGLYGYASLTNSFINSVVNAQTYLGPTFNNMDALITNNISEVNSNFAGFGIDLANQGQLYDLSRLDLYGTPAGLLWQISNLAMIENATLKVVEDPLIAAGLTKSNIATLISGQNTVSEIEFNRLQKVAYTGMTQVTGANLRQVLAVLKVRLPNIATMAELLDQSKIFPNSYKTLAIPSLDGPLMVYQDDGSVNMTLAPLVNAYLPVASGCDELGKIIPPDQAVANKATQIALQQISGISNSSLPQLAQVVSGVSLNNWSVNRSYLPNYMVSYGTPIPVVYQAVKSVPPGTDINDTEYWTPTSLGGLSTLTGLADLELLTSALPDSVIQQYNNVATGSGPNGTITICDMIGLAIDYNNFASKFNSAALALSSMPSSAALTSLIVAYQDMLTAGNDVQMQTYISNANSAIASIANPLSHPEYVQYVNTLNSVFDSMASTLSQEKTYQTKSGVNYADMNSNDTTAIYSFIQSLPSYGQDLDAGGPAYFLNRVADISTVGGQAIIGTMRESVNNQRLSNGQIGQNVTPSALPPLIPVPVITPVY